MYKDNHGCLERVEHVKGRKRNEEEEKLRETIKEGRINILVKENVKEDVKEKLEEIEILLSIKYI